MKNWSKKGETASVEELLSPLAKMIRKVYKLKDGVELDFEYKGFRVFGDVIQPDERFSKEFLSENLEDQGFDLIDNALITTLQYGVEQGKRINKDTIKAVILMAESGVTCATNLLPDDLKNKKLSLRKKRSKI